MALYEPAQHLLILKPPEGGKDYIQSTTRVWVNSGETIRVHKNYTNEVFDYSEIMYEVIPESEEAPKRELKLIQKVKWDGKTKQKVKVIVFEYNTLGEETPLGSTSNNSDDADIDKDAHE